MAEKLKAGITGTGFRFASPWEQFETLSKLGYHTSQNAVASIANMDGNLDENIARFKELNLGFYSSSLVKPMGMPRMGGDIKDMCTIKEGYMDMGMDHVTTTDQVIEDTIARCEKFGVNKVSCYGTPMINNMMQIPGLKACEKDVFYEAIEAHDKIAEKFLKAGIYYTYHNHNVEFDTIYDGLTAFDQIIARTSSLSIELDVGWALSAGYDPVAIMKRIKDRLVSLHVKDLVDGTAKNPMGSVMPRFTAVGTGKLPLEEVLKTALEIGLDTVIVEQDMLRNLDLEKTLAASLYNMMETGYVG